MDKVSVTIRPKQAMSARIPGVKVIDRGGVTDYNDLTGKPTLNGVEISGDKTAEDYGIIPGGGVTDYSMLTNLPKINDHTLNGGENSLSALGIGRASNTDINKLF